MPQKPPCVCTPIQRVSDGLLKPPYAEIQDKTNDINRIFIRVFTIVHDQSIDMDSLAVLVQIVAALKRVRRLRLTHILGPASSGH